MTKEQKRESVRQMIMKSKMSVETYKNNRVDHSKQELKQKTETEKQLIYKFEKEA